MSGTAPLNATNNSAIRMKFPMSAFTISLALRIALLTEFALKLENKINTLSRVLDDAAKNGVADNLADWMWKDLREALGLLLESIERVKESRGTGLPLGDLPLLEEPGVATGRHADLEISS